MTTAFCCVPFLIILLSAQVDVVVANAKYAAAQANELLLNDGAGAFKSIEIGENVVSVGIASADYNSDGIGRPLFYLP